MGKVPAVRLAAADVVRRFGLNSLGAAVSACEALAVELRTRRGHLEQQARRYGVDGRWPATGRQWARRRTTCERRPSPRWTLNWPRSTGCSDDGRRRLTPFERP